ncbi:MAG: Stp1/IreP family PP2C-type Ser/Thr phosphatase [Lachnospiraceae bacterium]|jgi:serine/threonine protein phosphatase PrpC|nr:Stp1/IreP family PP2C-type Ser/Thr phosphatase [Lachnospiraceae bacterium]NBJ80599.1 Stp1/IreP family PP2C-type Ser/Thr phosphatase [bacterium 1XD42-76]NBK03808.1 Stp1/IreP family PP2C-type Ser/Thr phosphatase [bacterium 1XD42-94]
MIAYAQTDIGRVRRINQDSIFASAAPVGPFPNLFIVADGMGGHKAGDFASRFLVERLSGFIKDSTETDVVTVLRKAIERVNYLLYQEAMQNPDRSGMGSTLVAATVSGGMMYVVNVGDSRLYLFRDELKQITRDHSLVEAMVSLGKMERNSESYESQKNIITRAVGIESEVEPDFFEVPLRKRDCVLLCSDGLTNMMEDSAISRILRSGDSLEQKTKSLIAGANENGGRDNIAVILAEPGASEVRLC